MRRMQSLLRLMRQTIGHLPTRNTSSRELLPGRFFVQFSPFSLSPPIFRMPHSSRATLGKRSNCATGGKKCS